MEQKSTLELIRAAKKAAQSQQNAAKTATQEISQPAVKENPLKQFLPKPTAQPKPVQAQPVQQQPAQIVSAPLQPQMPQAAQPQQPVSVQPEPGVTPIVPFQQAQQPNLTEQFTTGVQNRLNPANFSQQQKQATAQQNQEIAAREQRIEELPWYSNFWRSIKAGTRGMLSTSATTIGEIADLAETAEGMGGTNPLFPNKNLGPDAYMRNTRQRLSGGPDVQAGSGLRQFAKEQNAKASEIEYNPESLSGIAGGAVPYITGTALAIASAPISAPLATGVGALSLGSLTLSAVGGGIQEYDQYKDEKGLPKDQMARLGMGLLYGGAEFGMERLSLGRFVPKAFKGKVGDILFGAVPPEIIEKKSKELLEEFAKSSATRSALVKNALKETGSGILFEGNTELATELVNQFGSWLYKEKEDRDIMEVLNNAKNAWIGGAFMGGAMGPLSYGATRLVNDKRRKQQGEVILAMNNETGEAVEIVGPATAGKTGKDTYNAVRPNGKDIQVDESSIGEVVRIPYDTFRGLLYGKKDGQAIVETQANTTIQETANAEQNQIINEATQYAMPDENGNPVINTGTYNGEQVFVISANPMNPDAITIALPSGERKMVSRNTVSDMMQIPLDQYTQNLAPSAPPLFDPNNPIQVGETFDINGEEYAVTGVNMETGQVQAELLAGDQVDYVDIPIEAFQTMRRPAQPMDEQISQPESNVEGIGNADTLRQIFLPESNQQEFKPGEQVSFGKEQPQNAQPTQPTASAQPANVPTQSAQPVAGSAQPEVVADGGAQPGGEGTGQEVSVSKTKPVRMNGVMAIDENGNIAKEFTDRINQLKSEQNFDELDKIYSSVRILLNGVAQSKGENTVKAFEQLKKELEQYGKQVSQNKINQPTNESIQQTEAKTEQTEAQQEDVREREEVKGTAKKKRQSKPSAEQLRRQEIINRPAVTPKALARQWLLRGGKLKSTQSLENRIKGAGIGKGVMDETGMSGREMRSLIGIIDNKTGLSPEVAAERIIENLPENLFETVNQQDVRNALIEVLLSENRKDWIDNQDRETREIALDEYNEWLISQLSPEEYADFQRFEADQNFNAYLSENQEYIDQKADEYDEYINSQAYQEYIEQIIDENTIAEGAANVENRGGAGDIVEADTRDRRGEGQGGIPRKQDDTTSDKDSKPDATQLGPGTGNNDAGAGTQPIPAGGAGIAGDSFKSLNPKGKALQTLKAAQDAQMSDTDMGAIIKKLDFLNSQRVQFPNLTDSHENEIFEAINAKDVKLPAIAKRIADVAGSFAFDPKAPINFEKAKPEKGENKRALLDGQIENITKRLRTLGKLPKSNKAAQEEISVLTKELNKLMQQRQDTKTAEEATKPADQQDMFAAPKPPKRAADILNEDQPTKSEQLSAEAKKKADELKNLFGDFFDAGKNNLTSGGITPEQFTIAGKIIAKAGELGIVRFKQLIEWANQNIGTDKMRQYFDSFKAAFGANLMINNPQGENINEIASSKFEDYVNLQEDNQQDDATNRPTDSEPNRGISDAVQPDQAAIPRGPADVGNDREGNNDQGIQAEQPKDRPSGVGISTTVSRKPSDKPVQQQIGIFATQTEDTGVVDGRGNSIDGATGNDAGREGDVSVDKGTADRIESFADSFKRKIKLQKEAEKIPAKLLDKNNIRETLPVLLDEQQEDVIRAEERFFGEQHKKPELANGKGYLFTNGTGTGKTFTGLGVAKRFIKQGKGNILLVVPGQPKVADWKDAAEKLVITINPLLNTKDAGKGFVATTYANFTLNQALKDRDWDLIIYDESHLLMAEQKGNESARTVSHYKHSAVSERWALEKLKDATGLWEKQRELLDQIRNINLRINKDDTMKEIFQQGISERKKLEEQLKEIEAKQEKILPSLKERAKKNYENTKVLFLSASPFATVKNLAYANGTLFDWGDKITYEAKSRGKSTVDPKGRFFLDNFGAAFEWKNNQLQERSNSNAEAISMQEIAFGNKLAQQGVMSGRAIESNRDYARHFPLVTGFNRDLFNDAINEIYKNKGKYNRLSAFASKQFFEYENALQLMESMRTSMSLSRIDQHLKLGRKVVIFHKRHKADVSAPFAQIVMEAKMTAQAGLTNPMLSEDEKKRLTEMLDQAEAFEQDFAGLLKYEQTLDYSSTIDQITKKYGDQAVYFNGNISTKDKIDAIRQFNDDNSKVKIIVVHEQSGREGISLHDTTGKHQRVLMSMSLPSQSITTLQVEGRIYRIGQESDAVLEYPILGLDTEIAHFASKINKKVSTTENLAMGDGSRDLLKSFAFGVMNASDEPPSIKQGKGGKELDKREREEHSQFKKARLVYAGNQKIRGTRQDRQGVDFYPTPEPVGQKMVEWLMLKPTQKFMEPSAGKGAIAMWAPGSVKTTAIEPAMDLIGRLGSVIQNGETLQIDFMDHNIINKYDGIAMNPPFGSAGATAIEHLAKAAKHLKNGGRLTALIPVGATDKKFDAFMESKDASDLFIRGEILLPSVTFEKAGTAVNTRIVVIDKISKPKEEDATLKMTSKYINLRSAKTVDELFDRLENISMPDKIEVQGREQDQAETSSENPLSSLTQDRGAVIPSAKTDEGILRYKEGKHTQTGEILHLVEMTSRVDNYDELNKTAKFFKGFYDRYSKAFRFKDKASADAFIANTTGLSSDTDSPRFMLRPGSDQTQTPEFKKWFGDSKVVNPDGSPMVVYHGTKRNFDQFGREDRGYGLSHRLSFFSKDPKYASVFAGFDELKGDFYPATKDMLGKDDVNPTIYPVYLSIKNPKIVDSFTIENIAYLGNNEMIDEFIKNGYDGMMLEDMSQIVTLSPTQIKSATGNIGTFDPKNPDIRYQTRPKRAADILDTPTVETARKRVAKAQKEVDRVAGSWKNGPQISVFADAQALESELARLYPWLKLRQLDKSPGLYFRGRVYLNAAHPFHSEPNGTETAILHESIGHYGLNGIIDQMAAQKGTESNMEYRKLMNQVFDRYATSDKVAEISKLYFGRDTQNLTEIQRLEVAEEYFANVAQTGIKDSFLDRVMAKIRQILRSLGLSMKMSDAELRMIIGRSARFVKDGAGLSKFETSGPSLMQSMDSQDRLLEVVNGFYSPIEKKILEFKQPKASATKWKEIIGKKDEAVWTGIAGYLDGLKPDQQVGKQELSDWMNDNRVRIEVVEKSEITLFTKSDIKNVKTSDLGAGYWIVTTKDDQSLEFPLHVADDKQEAIDYALEQLNYDNVEKRKGAPKYSSYQLPGDKTDYKEVLVTLPNKDLSKFPEYLKAYRKRFPNATTTDEEVKGFFNQGAKIYDKGSDVFRSTHFDEPNILVHLRMNTRTDADGNKVLFLEELQSDWGQKGKKEGFKGKVLKTDLSYIEYRNQLWEKYNVESAAALQGKASADEMTTLAHLFDREENITGVIPDGIPSAPFVTDTNSWVKLGLKVALQEAVSQGVDKIAWTTGEQQNARYDLSKQVDEIGAKLYPDGTYSIVGRKNGTAVVENDNIPASKLSDFVGKELAEKIISSDANDGKWKYYEGDDLKIGGTGMKAFYGEPSIGDIGIVGRVAESIVGKGSVGVTSINQGEQKSPIDAFKYDGSQDISVLPGGDYIEKGDWIITQSGTPIFAEGKHRTKAEAIENFMNEVGDEFDEFKDGKGASSQPSITITPQVAEMVTGGMPLFMLKPSDQTQTPAFKAWFGDSKVVDSEGRPLVVYHGTPHFGFNEFKYKGLRDTGFLGNGFYFTKDKEMANSFKSRLEARPIGKEFEKVKRGVYQVYLSVKKPLIVSEISSGKLIELLENSRKIKGKTPLSESIKNEIRNEFQKDLLDTQKERLVQEYGSWSSLAKDNGYDGVFGAQENAIVVFSPTQIKSATGNIGTFDPQNPDIRYMLSPRTTAKKAKGIMDRLKKSANFITNKNYISDPAAVETQEVENQRRKTLFNKIRDTFTRENFQDAMLPGRRMLEAKFGKDIPDEQNFYTKENLAADRIVHQIAQMENKFIKPIKAHTDMIQDKYGLTFEQIEDYLAAKHDAERRVVLTEKNPEDAKKYAKDPKWPTGMTPEEAEANIRNFESAVDSKDVDKLHAIVKALVNFSLDKRLETGLISQKYYESLKGQYEFYVPLRGFDDRIEYDSTKYSPIKTAKGRKSKAASPLSYLYVDAADAITHGERNLVFQAVLEFAKKNPDNTVYNIKTSYYRKAKKPDGGEVWIEQNEEEAKPTREEIQKGTVIRGFNPEIMKDVAIGKSSEHILPVMVNGQRVTIQFAKGNEQLVRALRNAAYSKVEGFLKLSGKLNRFLSSMFTEYSPEFGLVNMARDFGMGSFTVIADDGFDMWKATAKNYRKSMRELMGYFWNKQQLDGNVSPYLKEFMESGAFTGFSQAKEVRDVYAELSNNSISKDLSDSMLATVVSTYNKSIENAMRFSYYQALRQNGASVQKAAQKAKDVTVNFRRRGNLTSNIGALYAFFNAGVQGTERFLRPFFQPGEVRKKAAYMAGTMFVTGFMQGMLYNLFGAIDDDDDELFYDKIPDYTKAMNIIIPFPNESGYIMVPLGYGINVPYALGELAAQTVLGKKKPSEALWRMLTISTDSFSPLGGYDFDDEKRSPVEQAVQFAAPTYSKPLVDLAINTNFAGFQIVPESPWDKGKPNSQNFSPNTNRGAIKAAQLINEATGGDDVVPGAIDINPTSMEYLIRQYGGGPLSFAQKTWRTGELLTSGENPLTGDDVRKAPFVSRFYVDANSQTSVTSKYFKSREQITIAMDRFENYMESNPEKAEKYYDKNRGLIDMSAYLDDYEKTLKTIRKEMNAVRGKDDKAFKRLEQERNAVMKEFNKIFGMVTEKKQIRAADVLDF